MKKKNRILIIFMLIFSLVLITGCGAETERQIQDTNQEIIVNPYVTYDLTQYIVLPDYEAYSVGTPEVTVSEEMVNEELTNILMDAGTVETVTEGTVEKGDVIQLSFSGTLQDGSTVDGISAEAFQLVLGKENMVEGFQEGIMGKEIGQPFQLNITFPEPYEIKEELAGQTVTFDIEILSKQVVVPAVLNDTFVTEHSDCTSIEEYLESVEELIKAKMYEEELQTVKQEIYLQIEKDTEVLKLPEELVEELRQDTLQRYKTVASRYEMEWEDFLMESFLMTQDDFDIQLLTYSREMIKQEMIIHALAQAENIQIDQEEYELFIQQQLENSGYKDAETFEQYVGKSVEAYVKENRLEINLLLNKTLDAIYARLNGALEN